VPRSSIGVRVVCANPIEGIDAIDASATPAVKQEDFMADPFFANTNNVEAAGDIVSAKQIFAAA
jgi:hypothetical protein